jgi:hypothetical protein
MMVGWGKEEQISWCCLRQKAISWVPNRLGFHPPEEEKKEVGRDWSVFK